MLPTSLHGLISGNRFKQVDRHGRVAVDRLAENIFEIGLLERRRPHDSVHRLIKIYSKRELLERRRPHDHVDRLAETVSEDELLKRRWPHDLVDHLMKIIPELRCWSDAGHTTPSIT